MIVEYRFFWPFNVQWILGAFRVLCIFLDSFSNNFIDISFYSLTNALVYSSFLSNCHLAQACCVFVNSVDSVLLNCSTLMLILNAINTPITDLGIHLFKIIAHYAVPKWNTFYSSRLIYFLLSSHKLESN